MIDITFATEQIRRLGGLNYFPREYPAALEELIQVAMTAETEEACRKAFDSILYDSDDCPKPSDIRRVIAVENEKAREIARTERTAPKTCPLCNGYGIKIRVYLITKTIKEIEGDVRPRITRRWLESDEEITAARAALQPDQEIQEGAEKCSCQLKAAS